MTKAIQNNLLPVLHAEGIGKEYRLFNSPRDRVKSLFSGKANYHSHWSLRDVSFSLNRGQCVGIVGDNGAGKSTLLKLMTGTLSPSVGSITRVGRVTAILELGTGFHPDFTGRENLYFGGSLIGISTEQMRELETSVIEFSELGDAINWPVKTYSSGMVVRLAFALVTAIEPDLLIVDEALAVGDQHFQKKCIDRINSFRANGCSILFCSHSQYHIRQLCDRAIWLDQGAIKAIGETETVLAAYDAHVRERDLAKCSSELEQQVLSMEPLKSDIKAQGHECKIEAVVVANLGNGDPQVLLGKDLEISVFAHMPSGRRPSFALMLEQSHGVGITSLATHSEGIAPTEIAPGQWRVSLIFPDLPLHTGDYVVSAYLFDEEGLVEYDKWYQCKHFRFIYPSKTPGLVRLPHHWR